MYLFVALAEGDAFFTELATPSNPFGYTLSSLDLERDEGAENQKEAAFSLV